jgi:hypothetical protein
VRVGFGSGWRCGWPQACYELSGAVGSVVCMVHAACRREVRFQGRNGWMSSGALPPATAQFSKYHVSHRRGLIFQ